MVRNCWDEERPHLFICVGPRAGEAGEGRQELPIPMQTSLPVTGEEGAGGARWASRVGRPPAAPSHPGTSRFPLSCYHRDAPARLKPA